MKKVARCLVGVLLASGLAACGGGGGSDSPPPVAPPPPPAIVKSSAEGIWSGPSTKGFSVRGVILENGEYWLTYYQGSTAFGLFQGSSRSDAGVLTSTNLLDFYAPDGSPGAGTFNATYKVNDTLVGNTVTSARTDTVDLRYESKYDEPVTPGLTTGVWFSETGPLLITYNVTATGSMTGFTVDGCTFSGSLRPRASGKFVYDISYTFGPAPCFRPGVTVSGVAIPSVSATGEFQLQTATLDSARSGGFLLLMRR
jgi:hypothetical protein